MPYSVLFREAVLKTSVSRDRVGAATKKKLKKEANWCSNQSIGLLQPVPLPESPVPSLRIT